MRQSNGWRYLIVAPALAFLASLAHAKTLSKEEILVRNEKLVRANTILLSVGPQAEGSLRHCFVDGYLQGLSMDEVAELCATELIEDESKGFGDGPLVSTIGKENFFDPTKVTAACAMGDASIAGAPNSSGWQIVPGYGGFSWGGNQQTQYQYDKQTAERLKQEAIERSKQADEEFNKLEALEEAAEKELKDAEKTGDKQAIEDAKKKHDEAYQKASEAAQKAIAASEEAKEDPNTKPVPNTRVASESPCNDALTAAREILRECHRTNWQASECQKIESKANGCADRTRILADPEHGYSCSKLVPDAKTLTDAWTAACESRKKFGPDTNPCVPPSFDEARGTGSGPVQDICKDPNVYINPESNDCRATLVIQGFGEVDLQQIAVWGMNKIGGPIIVLPPRDSDPPPLPGPNPYPTPKD